MREDKEDKHRVRRWCVEKGIGERDNVKPKSDEQDKMQVERDSSQGGLNTPSSSSGSSSSIAKRYNEVNDEGGFKRNRTDGANKKPEIGDSVGDDKCAARLQCLSFAGQRSISEEATHLIQQYQESRPDLVIFDSGTHEELMEKVKKCQAENMRCYNSINGSKTTTHSGHVVAECRIHKVPCNDSGINSTIVQPTKLQSKLFAIVFGAIFSELKMDELHAFSCEVDEGHVDQAQIEESMKGARHCHMKE